MSTDDDGPDLWVVRHGETDWSRDRRHTGRSDIPLTPAGERTARDLAPRLKAETFDLVMSSPLQRARHTAELAGLSPEVEPRAVEWDYGDYEGLTTAQVRERKPGWSIWDSAPPNGETLDQVAGRADQVIARIRTGTSRRALLIAHAHFLRVLAARWIGQPPHLAACLVLDTATVSVLSWDRGVPVIEHWNS